MALFKKIKEFNKLSQNFGRIYTTAKDIEEKSLYMDIRGELQLLAYVARIEIEDRLDEYRWSFNSKMMIAELKGTYTIQQAHQLTIGKIIELSISNGNYEEINNILDKGTKFTEIDNLRNS